MNGLDTLGKRLKFYRQQKGWTASYVCKLKNIPNSTLSGYENDYREPDLETLQMLAELYEVPLSDLVGDYRLSSEQDEKLKKSFETIREIRDRILRGEILDADNKPMSQELREFYAKQIELQILATEKQK